MPNGIDRLKYDARYAGDKRHNFVRMIMENFAMGVIDQTTPVTVAHEPSCAILREFTYAKRTRTMFCNCTPKLTVKHDA